MEPVPRPLHRLNKKQMFRSSAGKGFWISKDHFHKSKFGDRRLFLSLRQCVFSDSGVVDSVCRGPARGQYMPAFTLAGEAFCSVWASTVTFHFLCTLPLPEGIGFKCTKKKLSQVGGCIAGAACKVAASRRLSMLHS